MACYRVIFTFTFTYIQTTHVTIQIISQYLYNKYIYQTDHK